MNRINVAIIGYGRIGTRHAKHASTYGQLKIIVEPDEAKREKAKEEYPQTLILSNISEIEGENLDLCSVCTPNGLHVENAKECLQLGFNTLVEKPICLKYSEGVELLITDAQKTKPTSLFGKSLIFVK